MQIIVQLPKPRNPGARALADRKYHMRVVRNKREYRAPLLVDTAALGVHFELPQFFYLRLRFVFVRPNICRLHRGFYFFNTFLYLFFFHLFTVSAIELEPAVGIEPTTFSLRVRCSTN